MCNFRFAWLSDQLTSSHEQSYTDVLEDGADNHYLYDVSDELWEVPRNTPKRVRVGLSAENLQKFDQENSGAKTTSSTISSKTEITVLKRKPTPAKNATSKSSTKSNARNVDNTQSYANTDFDIAAEAHHTRVRLAQLENIMQKDNTDPTHWCGSEMHEDWLENPPPVGPSLETERLKSLSLDYEMPQTRKRKV